MKRILVTTDFSVAADNAVNYAAELAHEMNAFLNILNCFHIPVSTGEIPVPMMTIDELQKSSTDALGNEKKRISEKFPKLSVHIHSWAGFAAEEIADYAEAHHINLIIMGITGAGKFSERIIGSTSTSVVKNTQCPVLIIPKEGHFNKPAKIGLACDFKEIIHPAGFHILKELIAHFGATLEVFNILKPDEGAAFEKAIAGIRLENILSEAPHSLHFPENKDVIEGVNDFLVRHKLDIITLVSKKHGFFNKLIHESNTKKLAFHTHIPLLVIHNK